MHVKRFLNSKLSEVAVSFVYDLIWGENNESETKVDLPVEAPTNGEAGEVFDFPLWPLWKFWNFWKQNEARKLYFLREIIANPAERVIYERLNECILYIFV